MKLSFGERILLLRKRKNLSQKQLAEHLDVDQKELSEWEGDNSYPSFDMAIKLADELDISLDYLACRIDQQPDKKWIQWAAEIPDLSEKTKKTLFYTVEVCINVDKTDRIYNKEI
jgi:transcriptional regulator with XRE-family HTH domain